jgi:hypothetical protein
MKARRLSSRLHHIQNQAEEKFTPSGKKDATHRFAHFAMSSSSPPLETLISCAGAVVPQLLNTNTQPP